MQLSGPASSCASAQLCAVAGILTPVHLQQCLWLLLRICPGPASHDTLNPDTFVMAVQSLGPALACRAASAAVQGPQQEWRCPSSPTHCRAGRTKMSIKALVPCRHLRDLLADNARCDQLFHEHDSIFCDFSRQRVTSKTLEVSTASVHRPAPYPSHNPDRGHSPGVTLQVIDTATSPCCINWPPKGSTSRVSQAWQVAVPQMPCALPAAAAVPVQEGAAEGEDRWHVRRGAPQCDGGPRRTARRPEGS